MTEGQASGLEATVKALRINSDGVELVLGNAALTSGKMYDTLLVMTDFEEIESIGLDKVDNHRIQASFFGNTDEIWLQDIRVVPNLSIGDLGSK